MNQKSSLVKKLMNCLNLRGLKVTRVVLALTLLKLPLQEPSLSKSHKIQMTNKNEPKPMNAKNLNVCAMFAKQNATIGKLVHSLGRRKHLLMVKVPLIWISLNNFK